MRLVGVTEEELRANDVPVLAIVGDAEQMAPPEVERMVGLVPKLELTIWLLAWV